ncbi:hypothetical protein MLD38_010248 [Melastoma candidum]|uniref:Uncharacterized protein n=1 Tax=Melastoma candidum TaxID=119954 RepID=A0ACB9R2R9_9MYRT|nr:hypothetical protein MLD38_010248 [Melastoma candidum]
MEQVRWLIRDVTTCAQDGLAVNIGEASFRAALNLLSNTVFSVNLEGSVGCSRIGELKEIVTNIMTEVGSPNIADFFPALKRWDPQGRKRRLEVCFGRMFDIFDEMMEKRMEGRGKKGWQRKDDVLEMLLDICQDEDEEAVDLVLIKHMFLDVFAAGTDTTSSTLEWVMTELLRSREKLYKAQSEVRDVIARGNLVEESDYPHLPYLQAVIKETFRLHPPAPFLLPRIAGEEKLVGTPEGGPPWNMGAAGWSFVVGRCRQAWTRRGRLWFADAGSGGDAVVGEVRRRGAGCHRRVWGVLLSPWSIGKWDLHRLICRGRSSGSLWVSCRRVRRKREERGVVVAAQPWDAGRRVPLPWVAGESVAGGRLEEIRVVEGWRSAGAEEGLPPPGRSRGTMTVSFGEWARHQSWC